MDWDRITTDAEAEVCLFRLLAALPDGMTGFTAFAQAQGFSVSDTSFNPVRPSVERGGSLRVTAHWSISRNGPKYPGGGFDRMLRSLAYGMDFNATYSSDGWHLLYVRISSLFL
jgi:hypothetical protein